MKLTSFEAIAAALERAQVRYLIAGGLAVNAHGHPRFTNDIDWSLTTYEGARREQRRRWATLPPLREMIQALEDMESLAMRLGPDPGRRLPKS